MELPENQHKDDRINEDNLKHTKIGMQICLDHIDRLLEDSKLLIKKKRYSASIPPSILAIEEIGKAHIMSEFIRLHKPLPDNVWKEITRGGVAHVKKVTSIIFSRKLSLENFTPESEQNLNEMMNSIGIPIADVKLARIDNMIMRGTFLRLEQLKQDCFYTNLDANKNWITFDNRFNEYKKKAIATYLHVLALRTYTHLKFTQNIPQKPFKKYSNNEKKNMKSMWKKEVEPIMKKTDTKEIGHLTDLGILTINNAYSPDKRGFVTEGDNSIFDF